MADINITEFAQDVTELGTSHFKWIDASQPVEPVLDLYWRIRNVLPPEGIGVLYGRSGSGKTFKALDIGCHVAANKPWRGHMTKGGTVAYVSLEGGRFTVNRVIAWKEEHDAEPRLLLTHQAVDLRSSEDDANALIGELQDHNRRNPQHPVVIVIIDTLSRAFGGGNENAPDDMGAFVNIISRIAAELGCLVLVVHHSGKDEARGSRGHSSLQAATNVEIEIKRDQGKPGVMKITKQRDGEDGTEFGFDLKQVLIGVDQDGQEVTTCVVVEADASESKKSSLNDKQKRALDVFRDLAVDIGEPAPDQKHYPPGAVVVPVEIWRTHLFKAGVLDAKARNPREPFRRLKAALADKGALCEWDRLLWEPKTEVN